MDTIRLSGNQLFYGSREFREPGCGRDYEAHFQDIACASISPAGKWVISWSKDGKLKVWNPMGSFISARTMAIDLAGDLTAVAITDSGERIAAATGLIVRIYRPEYRDYGRYGLIQLETVSLETAGRFTDKIVRLEWNDDDNVSCSDAAGATGIVTRVPTWTLS